MQVCARIVKGTEHPHAVCTWCGHYSGLHPGAPNPGADVCFGCLTVFAALPAQFEAIVTPVLRSDRDWVLPGEAVLASSESSQDH